MSLQTITVTVAAAAAGVIVQQTQAAAAVASSTRPAPVQSKGPCPPAEESLAACVELGLLEIVGPPRPGEGKPHQYRSLRRLARSPHDSGIIEEDEKGGAE